MMCCIDNEKATFVQLVNDCQLVKTSMILNETTQYNSNFTTLDTGKERMKLNYMKLNIPLFGNLRK